MPNEKIWRCPKCNFWQTDPVCWKCGSVPPPSKRSCPSGSLNDEHNLRHDLHDENGYHGHYHDHDHDHDHDDSSLMTRDTH
ncbi:Protein of unknown function [Pyronema omphalodes CBS 100304]|uniref:Uncharacterized protein n=1 Tax=Pyronema omphalodes (strain CBS 100304) TaxID=1076935 RepID=U4L8J0_PYROM|nr:Protein of unknown function [Pyronema omphalodes CBS 100304]